MIAVWVHSDQEAANYLEYLSSIDAPGTVKFIEQTENENNFRF